MKANDLRVGNWVSIREKPFQVYTFSRTGIDEYAGEDNKGRVMTYPWKISACSPITLTPDILEKAGFTERKHLDDWFISLKDTGTILIIMIGFDVANICPSNQKPCLYIHCAYLHQLQNLYYALTGEELTIDLN